MLEKLPSWLKGSLSITSFILFTLMSALPVFLFGLLKIIPIKSWRHMMSICLNKVAGFWVDAAHFTAKLMGKTQIEVEGLGELKRKEWYLIIANHQSWVDIFMLTRVLHKRIPMFRFFLKRQLLLIPVIGFAFWAMDFPVMRRYSKATLTKNPNLKGKDTAASKKACEKYLNLPVSIVNFCEGTRFDELKHKIQESPYKHLLKPRAGGVAFVINAMQDRLHYILNVTIVYPDGVRGFWDYLCGKVKRVKVHIEALPIKRDLIGDYDGDQAFRLQFQLFLNELWARKDTQIETMLATK